MEFEEWWSGNLGRSMTCSAKEIWQAAQDAERKSTKKLMIELVNTTCASQEIGVLTDDLIDALNSIASCSFDPDAVLTARAAPAKYEGEANDV